MAAPSAPAAEPPARRNSDGDGAPQDTNGAVGTRAVDANGAAAEGYSRTEKQDGTGKGGNTNDIDDEGDDTSVDDDYLLFVKSLGSAGWGADDPLHLAGIADSLSVSHTKQEDCDEDDDEFRLDSSSDEEDGEEEDEEEGGGGSRAGTSTGTGGKSRGTKTPDRIREGDIEGMEAVDVDDDDDEDWTLGLLDPRDLELELNWLEQEDMEAAVATLLLDSAAAACAEDCGIPNNGADVAREERMTSTMGSDGDAGVPSGNADNEGGTGKPSGERDADLMLGRRLRPNRTQHQQLRELLQQHYQLLLQQSVLAARLAHRVRSKGAWIPPASPSRLLADGEELMANTESTEDLAEILDAAVGMLQDLDQNRKDAIRHYVQFSDPSLAQTRANPASTATGQAPQRALWKAASRGGPDQAATDGPGSPEVRRLTRAQFSKTLISKESREGEGITVFAIPGIPKLKDTFSYIDKSVSDANEGSLVTLPTVCHGFLVVQYKHSHPAARVSHNFPFSESTGRRAASCWDRPALSTRSGSSLEQPTCRLISWSPQST
jgi:hypothetical protein